MNVATGDILYGTFLLFVFFGSMKLMRSARLAILVKLMLAGGSLAALWEFYDDPAWRHFDFNPYPLWDLLRPERLALAGLGMGTILFLRDWWAPEFTGTKLIMSDALRKARHRFVEETQYERDAIARDRAEMEQQIETLAAQARAQVDRERQDMQREMETELIRTMETIQKEREQLNREHAKAMEELVRTRRDGDPHEVLGLNKSASGNEVKSRYRELARRFHPDTIQSRPDAVRELAEARMKQLNTAYEKLKG